MAEDTGELPTARLPGRGRFLGCRAAVLGSAVFGVLGIVAVLAPVVAPYDPLTQAAAALQNPGSGYLFGTDELGRDILSRVVYGTRISLLTAVGAAVFAGVIGVPLGLLAGYIGGWVDAVTMRTTDFVLSIPAILFALVVVAVLGPGVLNLVLAIAIISIPPFARLARASTLSIREQEYVLAARSMGAGRLDIMGRTILPNILGPIMVQMVVTASVAILVSAALSFLGLGTPPPAPSWGGMLQSSRSYLYQAPWYGVFPGVALAITIAAFDGIGRGLQEAFGSAGPSRARMGAVG